MWKEKKTEGELSACVDYVNETFNSFLPVKCFIRRWEELRSKHIYKMSTTSY